MDKIRVLHLITRIIVGGAQENTMLTADLLDKTRYEVEVWSGSQAGSEGTLLEEFKRRNIKLEFIPEIIREINPIKDLWALYKLVRKLKEKNFDIIHTHSSKAGILGRIAGWLTGTPIIIHTVHGWSFHERLNPKVRSFYIFFEKMMDKITDKFITVTDLDIKKGIEAGISNSQKYKTIHSSIELHKFRDVEIDISEYRSQLGVNNDDIIVGTVARLSPQKAPIDFVEMAKIVHDANPNVKFIYVGDGPLRSDVEQKIQEYGLEDTIFLLGLRRDVPEILHCIDIFVLTSHWEGLPRVFSQSMAAAKPIVATNVDGAPEAIKHEFNGFLVKAGDIKDLAYYIGLLINDRKLRENMGINGLKSVDPAFCSKAMVRQIEEVYEAFLRKRKI